MGKAVEPARIEPTGEVRQAGKAGGMLGAGEGRPADSGSAATVPALR